MARPEILELMGALVTAEDERGKPPSVSVDEAIEVSQHFHAEADRGAEFLPKVAAQLGVTIACTTGCNGCCHELVMVRGPEAAEVIRWLDAEEQLPVRRTFMRAYPEWRNAVGDAPERLVALLAGGDQQAYNAAHRAQWKKGVLCAFNHEGLCLIYPVRPMACRTAHAVGTNEHCHPASESGQPAQRVVFVPLDDLTTLARRVMRAADRASRGATAGHEALVKVVAGAMVQKGN